MARPTRIHLWLPLVLASALVSCTTTWTPYTAQARPSSDLPELLRLTLYNGEQVSLRDPLIDGDTAYVGTTRDSAIRRVPRSLVLRVDEGDPPNALVGLAATAGVLVVVAAMAINSN